MVWGWRGALKRDGQQIFGNYIQDEQILDVAGGDSGVGSEHLS